MKRSKRQYGRVHVPDERDRAFALAADTTTRRRRFWNASWCGDQGSTPHCVGFAWAHWQACPPRPAYLDGHGIYSLCLFVDEWPGERDQGTSVRAAAKIYQRVGMLREYRWAKSQKALLYTLLEVGPVVAGTNWCEGMDTPDDDGLLHVAGGDLGGHAYLVDGVNLDAGLARVKCAWWEDGRPWGDNGRAWISLKELWQLIDADGEACLGVKANVRARPEAAA